MGIRKIIKQSILHRKKQITMKKNFALAIGLLFIATFINAQRLPKAPCTTLVNEVIHDDLKTVDTTKSRGVVNNYAMWENGSVILVKFMPGGSKALRDKIMQSAKE